MRERKEIVDEFATFINQEMQNCIEQNIEFSELAGYKKILVLQSAPVHVLQDVLGKIYKANEDIQVIIAGQNACEDLKAVFKGKNIELILHDKSFGDDDFALLQQTEEEYQPEAVLYFNNFASCVDFSNVEHLLWLVENKIPIYSYSYVQQELNRHTELSYHLYGCIVYKDLLEWFRTFK